MAERKKHPYLDSFASVQSSSQQDLWDQCQRRWGFTYILGLREPGSPATDLGTEVEDTQLQPYILEDRPFDYSRDSGYIAAPAVPHLVTTKANPNTELQKHILVRSALDPTVAYQGFLDVFEPDIVPTIKDFKTSANPEKWGKTADELKSKNRQSILYAHWALRGGMHLGSYPKSADPEDLHYWNSPSPAHGSVQLSWIYLRTKPPYRAKPVKLQLWQGDTDRSFHTLIDVPGQVIAKARKSCTDPRDLTPNFDACRAFNKPCPHLERCFPTAPREENKMIDISKIAARINSVQTTPVTITPPVLPVGGLVPVTTLISPPALPVIGAPAPGTVVLINPPESAIDPATVPKIDLAPLPASSVQEDEASTDNGSTSVADAPLKQKRTRRTKAQIEADNLAAARAKLEREAGGLDQGPDLTTEFDEDRYRDQGDAQDYVPETKETVTATYGTEKICIGHSTCEIGPFSYTATVQPGETALQALNRAQDVVKTIAGSAINTKLPAFLNLLQSVPGAK